MNLKDYFFLLGKILARLIETFFNREINDFNFAVFIRQAEQSLTLTSFIF